MFVWNTDSVLLSQDNIKDSVQLFVCNKQSIIDLYRPLNVCRTFRLGEEFANINKEFFEEPEVHLFHVFYEMNNE